MKGNYDWINIAEKIANKILEYKNNDEKLMNIIQSIKTDEEINNNIEQIKIENKLQRISNIDGFTAINIIFMRIKNSTKRAKFIAKFEEKTGMKIDKFDGEIDGIPYLINNRVRLTNGKIQEKELKEALWDLFEIAIKYADNKTKENENDFVDKYDKVYVAKEKCDKKVDEQFKKGLTVALYIIRPYTYVPLDKNTKEIVEKIYSNNIDDGKSYINMIKKVNEYITNNYNLEYKNIPEMSTYAFKKDILNNKWYAVGCFLNGTNVKDLFYKKQILAIGWENLGNLKDYTDNEKLKEKISKIDNTKAKNTNMIVKTINYFKQLKEGDIIVLKSSSNKGQERKIGFTRIFAIGRVLQDFNDGYNLIKGIGHTIPVDWIYNFGDGIDIDKLSLIGTILEIKDTNKRKIYSIVIDGDNNKENNTQTAIAISNNAKIEKGKNVIIYGVPGSGKSWYVENELLKGISQNQRERVIFHPEYTYYEFVGQNIPDGKGGVKFEEGPFTRILSKALKESDKNYYLIIEEMNRGNAEAIFGDILQLLDRDENGRSRYEISNPNLEKELNQKSIYLPSNLIIYATINNADQNVFTLDTAFGRRWRYEIKYCNPKEDEENKIYFDSIIKGTNVKWNEFRESINKEILNNKEEIYNAEDKRLGLYYIDLDCLAKENEIIENEKKYREKFANKIFRYLWLDVLKNNRDKLFKEDYNSLEDLIIEFKENGKFEEIFNMDFNKEDNTDEN